MQQATESEGILLVCNQCHFERLVEGEDATPAEILIRHGRETGHKLSIEKQVPPA